MTDQIMDKNEIVEFEVGVGQYLALRERVAEEKRITEQDQADFESWCNMQQDIEAGKLEVLKNGGCPKCSGTGFVSHIENAAPMGSGEMWGMDVVNECECWVGKTPHCPACGSDKLEWTEDESDATCQTCGWTSIYQESSGKD